MDDRVLSVSYHVTKYVYRIFCYLTRNTFTSILGSVKLNIL